MGWIKSAAEVLEQARGLRPAAGVKELPVLVSVAGWRVPDDWTVDRMSWQGPHSIILRASGPKSIMWLHLDPCDEVEVEEP